MSPSQSVLLKPASSPTYPLFFRLWLPPEAFLVLASFTQITPPITHQWGAASPHRSAAILLQFPARTQTPKHPMQTKSPLALMEPRFAVIDQIGWQNSSWVHRTRESCARSPIVRLHYNKIVQRFLLRPFPRIFQEYSPKVVT